MSASPRERFRGACVRSSSDRCPAATGGSFRKAITRTSASARWAADSRLAKLHLRAVCDAHGIPFETLTSVRGHRLPLRRPATRLAGPRALLVGDAAGLIDPVSGDGMYECFVSASLAAQAIVDLLGGSQATLEPYAGGGRAALAPSTERLEDQAGARPLAPGLVAVRTEPARLAQRGAPAAGRARPPGRAARPRTRAVARARDSRPLVAGSPTGLVGDLAHDPQIGGASQRGLPPIGSKDSDALWAGGQSCSIASPSSLAPFSASSSSAGSCRRRPEAPRRAPVSARTTRTPASRATARRTASSATLARHGARR